MKQEVLYILHTCIYYIYIYNYISVYIIILLYITVIYI